VLYLKKKEELEEQRKNIQESIKHLKKVPLKKETLSDYKYYEGISGVKSMWLEIGKMMKKGTHAAIFGAILKEFKELNEFYMEHHKLRIKKGVSMRMILSEDARKLGKQREKLGLFEVRYKELENEAEFGVYGDFMYIQHSGQKTARSFLIKDPIFTRSFESIFNKLWETAKR
jgi:sugar-specific transcriptional regulator TrmB